jgi:hypothetical protein
MSFVIVPHPMGMISLPEIRKKAETAFPLILKAATEWKPEAKLPPMKPVFPADKFQVDGTIEEVNRVFLRRDCPLAFPFYLLPCSGWKRC